MPSDRQSVATSSRCSASAMSSTRARRSSGVSAPVTASMRSFGKALRRPAATCSAVAMKRQKTTGLAPSAISGFNSFDQRFELRIGVPWQGARPAPQARRAARLRPSPDAGSTSTASASSASSSKTCSSSRSGRRQGGCAARSARRPAMSRHSASVRACPRMPAGGGVGPARRLRPRRSNSRAPRRGRRDAPCVKL